MSLESDNNAEREERIREMQRRLKAVQRRVKELVNEGSERAAGWKRAPRDTVKKRDAG